MCGAALIDKVLQKPSTNVEHIIMRDYEEINVDDITNSHAYFVGITLPETMTKTLISQGTSITIFLRSATLIANGHQISDNSIDIHRSRSSLLDIIETYLRDNHNAPDYIFVPAHTIVKLICECLITQRAFDYYAHIFYLINFHGLTIKHDSLRQALTNDIAETVGENTRHAIILRTMCSVIGNMHNMAIPVTGYGIVNAEVAALPTGMSITLAILYLQRRSDTTRTGVVTFDFANKNNIIIHLAMPIIMDDLLNQSDLLTYNDEMPILQIPATYTNYASWIVAGSQ